MAIKIFLWEIWKHKRKLNKNTFRSVWSQKEITDSAYHIEYSWILDAYRRLLGLLLMIQRSNLCKKYYWNRWSYKRAENPAATRVKAVVVQFRNCRSWIILLVFIFVCWQCSFHHIKVHSQSRAHLKVWVILSALKNDCLVNWDKLEHNWFPVFIIDTRWLAELIPCLLLYKLIVTHCCPELCPNTNSLA